MDAQNEELYDLSAPGMPEIGPDFLALARAQNDGSELVSVKIKGEDGKHRTVRRLRAGGELENLVRRALREPGFTMPVAVKPTVIKTVPFVCGHLLGQNREAWHANLPAPVNGPHPAKVMVIGKAPAASDVKHGRCFTGTAGQLLIELLLELHVKNLGSWYATNLVRFLPPVTGSSLAKSWVKDCMPLLHQELRIVRPDYILCLGADASKALLGGASFGTGNMDGRVMDFEFCTDREFVEDPGQRHFHTAQVMTVLNPGQVLRDPSARRTLVRGLERFHLLTQGHRFDSAEQDLDHRTVRTLEELEDLLNEIENDPEKTDNWLAVDAEWHGEHPGNPGSYLRTLQFAWREKHAAAVIWAEAGGRRFFSDESGRDARGRAVKLLNAFFTGKRICGHFLVADLEWLASRQVGLFSLKKGFSVPLYDRAFADFTLAQQQELTELGWQPGETVPAFVRTLFEGGWDTGLAAHAIEETAQLGLEMLTNRYTTCPRYDLPVQRWKEEWCKKNKKKASDLEGYGFIPDDVLVPYACLHKDSLVQRADGGWEKISSLVARRYAGKVKSLDAGRVVDASVIGWHRNAAGQGAWLQLQTVSAVRGRWGLIGPAFTPDHKILTRRGLVAVASLLPGEDEILTDEATLTNDQLSVLLGSLLGDGGWQCPNNSGTGFGFSQCLARSAYADWKADVFSNFNPQLRPRRVSRRYELPFTRYFSWLASRFECKPVNEHARRKARITQDLLDHLGDRGLAVWYQDDGTLVQPHRGTAFTARIYCRISPVESALLLGWLRARFGNEISYNKNGGFIQFAKTTCHVFLLAINPYMHAVMAYKTPWAAEALFGSRLEVCKTGAPLYCDKLVAVVPWKPSGTRRGYGVRYCLTVKGAHNFLTQVGFVSNCCDADATLRLMYAQLPLIESDYNGNCCREPFWESMITTPVILEMHQEGMKVDKGRLDYLTQVFVAGRSRQQEQIQTWAGWPEFNIRSVQHVREFLFGELLNGRRDKLGRHVRIRPEGARTLNLEPVLDTGKPPKAWAEIREKGLEEERSPGTGKTILGVLAADNPDQFSQVQWIRDYRFTDQVLKSVLRPPLTDKDGRVLTGDMAAPDVADARGALAAAGQTDNLSGMLYDAGLASVICGDGRVRTHLYPTAETGRWRSARPPMQNFSKRRDEDYKRILGEEQYKYKLRSMIQADPGRVFIEADYIGAELYCAAIMANDAHMLDHCRRNQLKESDPDYYDIHSNIAVAAFQLKVPDKVLSDKVCGKYKLPAGTTVSAALGVPVGTKLPATKTALTMVGMIALRIAAKNVIFGLMYGRGAKAIALQCKEEGNSVTVDQAQQTIFAVFIMYPGLQPFFDACRSRVHDPGWLATCFGRMRRFPVTEDEAMLAECERQAMNMPIQSMVASVVDRALAYMKDYRDNVLKDLECFRFKLQIHDAVILSAPYSQAGFVADHVLPLNMVERVPIWPTDLGGSSTGAGPFHLGIDVEMFDHWGEPLTRAFCTEHGIPLKFAH